MKEKLARLIECERIIRRVTAELLRLIAELNVDQWAARDIAMALQLSQSNGEDLVAWATRLATTFPEVLAALEAGTISERSAHGLVDPTENFSDELARKAVAKTLRPPKAVAANSSAVPCRGGCSGPIRPGMRSGVVSVVRIATSCSTTKTRAWPPSSRSSRSRSPR